MDTLFAAPLGALLIFLLRIVDVAIGTFRLIIGVRGYRMQASVLGFFEVLVWLFAVGAALQHLNSVLHIAGYAGGFAAGNFVGIWLDQRLGMGVNVVRAVCRTADDGARPGAGAAAALRSDGFAVTEVEGRGQDDPVNVLNVVAKRRQVNQVIDIVHAHAPEAFITVQEVRATRGGFFRPAGRMPVLTNRR